MNADASMFTMSTGAWMTETVVFAGTAPVIPWSTGVSVIGGKLPGVDRLILCPPDKSQEKIWSSLSGRHVLVFARASSVEATVRPGAYET